MKDKTIEITREQAIEAAVKAMRASRHCAYDYPPQLRSVVILARTLKGMGLHSDSTYIGDIATSIMRRACDR